MNTRLKKEFRALLLPWVVGAAASLLIPLLILCNEGVIPHLHGDAWPFLTKCAVFVACGSIPLLAAMSFGTEYQYRTLPLLLAQPLERSRQWREKFVALTVATATVALIAPVFVSGAALLVSGRVPLLKEREVHEIALMVAVTILTTICSTGYWTMVARSIIGGLAFSAAAQFMVGVTVGLVLHKIYGDLPLNDSIITCVTIGTGLIYSAVFLWLGRRKFIGLEPTDIILGEGITSGTGSLLRWRPAVLRCRTDSPLLNLVRKELRLQKTVFDIAGVLLLCWIVTLLLSFAAPIPKSYREGIFGALVCGYVFLLPVLAGCVPQGEERTLGLAAWHLTLPVSARLQWFIKLVISVAVAMCIGLLLPLLLLNVTAALGKVDATDFKLDATNFVPNSAQLSAVLAAIGLPFLLSFWAVTFLGNPVKAVVAAVIAVGALGSTYSFGLWCSVIIGPLETLPISAVAACLQLPIYQYPENGLFAVLFWSAIVAVAAVLAQSFIQFRQTASRPRALLRNATILAILMFSLSFWTTDVMQSFSALSHQVSTEVAEALSSLSFKKTELLGAKVTLRELERTGHLSWFSKTWLRNASVTVVSFRSEHVPLAERYGLPDSAQAMITFPNGGGFPVSFPIYKHQIQ